MNLFLFGLFIFQSFLSTQCLSVFKNVFLSLWSEPRATYSDIPKVNNFPATDPDWIVLLFLCSVLLQWPWYSFVISLNHSFDCLTQVANNKCLGQWLWLSWQSGHFQFQRSVVRIPSSANVYTINCIEKTKIKKKKPGIAH